MEWGIGLGVVLMLALLPVGRHVAGLFTTDPDVIAATVPLLVWLAVLQPLAGAAFTLDGILIGGSDAPFLAVSMAAASLLFAAVAIAALELGWGTAGLAGGATAWMAARTATTGARLARRRWVKPLAN